MLAKRFACVRDSNWKCEIFYAEMYALEPKEKRSQHTAHSSHSIQIPADVQNEKKLEAAIENMPSFVCAV